MKRSEMVKSMTEYWFGLFPDEPIVNMGVDQRLFDEVRERMSKLLEYLEAKGMKPPVEDVCPVLFQTKHVWERES